MVSDPFLALVRQSRTPPVGKTGGDHGERKHSKFSASGAKRWFMCPGSVALSEGLPDKSSIWAEEGTRAHEVLEKLMLAAILMGGTKVNVARRDPDVPHEMQHHAVTAANFILDLHARTPGSEILVETRMFLQFIHPEAFGTFDGAVIDHFGTLHVFDFKYGAGVPVSPVENLQMVFYAMALADAYHWNFKRVRMWIIQPRIKGYEGPLYWEISLPELQEYIPKFKAAVERVEREPDTYVESSECHWCKAKSICPIKRDAKLGKAQNIFASNPIQQLEYKNEEEIEESYVKKVRKNHGSEAFEKEYQGRFPEEAIISEADWRKKARKEKARRRR